MKENSIKMIFLLDPKTGAHPFSNLILDKHYFLIGKGWVGKPSCHELQTWGKNLLKGEEWVGLESNVGGATNSDLDTHL